MTLSPHLPSAADLNFLAAFRAAKIDLTQFDHPAHLRLAYTLLCSMSIEKSIGEISKLIPNALTKNKMSTEKFHVTLTCAWTEAVGHFMQGTTQCRSADEFISLNPALLDSRIMLNHYTEKRLFSKTARAHYLTADIDPIPRYA